MRIMLDRTRFGVAAGHVEVCSARNDGCGKLADGGVCLM